MLKAFSPRSCFICYGVNETLHRSHMWILPAQQHHFVGKPTQRITRTALGQLLLPACRRTPGKYKCFTMSAADAKIKSREPLVWSDSCSLFAPHGICLANHHVDFRGQLRCVRLRRVAVEADYGFLHRIQRMRSGLGSCCKPPRHLFSSTDSADMMSSNHKSYFAILSFPLVHLCSSHCPLTPRPEQTTPTPLASPGHGNPQSDRPAPRARRSMGSESWLYSRRLLVQNCCCRSNFDLR